MKINEIILEQITEASLASYAKQPFRAIGNVGTNLARGYRGQSRAPGRGVTGQFTPTGTMSKAAHSLGQGAQAVQGAVGSVIGNPMDTVTSAASQLHQALSPYTGNSMFTPGTRPSGKYVPTGSTYNEYKKTEDGWADKNGNILGSIYQQQLDKLWHEQEQKRREKARIPQKPSAPTPGAPGTPGAPAKPGGAAPSAPPPQVKTPKGEIVTKYGNKWYDEAGAEIVNPADVAQLEKRWKSQAQTRQMTPGGTPAQIAALKRRKKGAGVA